MNEVIPLTDKLTNKKWGIFRTSRINVDEKMTNFYDSNKSYDDGDH